MQTRDRDDDTLPTLEEANTPKWPANAIARVTHTETDPSGNRVTGVRYIERVTDRIEAKADPRPNVRKTRVGRIEQIADDIEAGKLVAADASLMQQLNEAMPIHA